MTTTVVGKTDLTAVLPEQIKDIDADYIRSHELILKRLPEALKDYKYETKFVTTNFGKELDLRTNAPKEIIYELSKEIGVPNPMENG